MSYKKHKNILSKSRKWEMFMRTLLSAYLLWTVFFIQGVVCIFNLNSTCNVRENKKNILLRNVTPNIIISKNIKFKSKFFFKFTDIHKTLFLVVLVNIWYIYIN